jgi:flagellar biosynthesis anti-sigma factor FlgM
MEIQGNMATPSAVTGRGDTPAAGTESDRTGQAADHGAGRSGETRVALSQKARGMLSIRQAVDLSQGVRQDRVDELKARVDAGTYNVEGKVVVRAVLREAMLEAVA